MMYGLEAMKNSIVRAENAARRAAARRREESGASRESALNYRILRNILEESEAEAWARLFACDLFACGKNARAAAACEAACV